MGKCGRLDLLKKGKTSLGLGFVLEGVYYD